MESAENCAVVKSSDECGIVDVPTRLKFVRGLDRLQSLFNRVCERNGNSIKDRSEFAQIVDVLTSYVEWIDKLNDDGMKEMLSFSRENEDKPESMISDNESSKFSERDCSTQTDQVAPDVASVENESRMWSKNFPYVVKAKKRHVTRFNLSDLPYDKSFDVRGSGSVSELNEVLADLYPGEKNVGLMMIRQQVDFWRERYKNEKFLCGSKDDEEMGN